MLESQPKSPKLPGEAGWHFLSFRFHGRLEGNVIAGENGTRLSLRRDGASLIIRDKNDFVFTRIEMLPAACRDAREDNSLRNSPVISLTASAKARIRELKLQGGKPYLRVFVVRGGPTGLVYELQFDDQLNPDRDYIEESDGITVVIDRLSVTFAAGASIDWQIRDDRKEGFHFYNPNPPNPVAE